VNLKHLISVLIACILVLQTAVFAETEETEYQPLYLREYNILNSLGIFEISGDGEFSGDAELTRAEAAAVAARLLGVEYGHEISEEQWPYTDVSSDYIYAYEIIIAYDYGIMQGYNGEFNPDGAVTGEQFLKVITATLGYKLLAEQRGGFPEGYVLTASELGLLEGVSYNASASLTHDKAVKIVYNALDAEVCAIDKMTSAGVSFETGDDLLSYYLDIEKGEGVVNSNQYTSLTDSQSGSEGTVNIGGTVYYCENGICDSLLGCNVEFYYKTTNGQYTVLYAEAEDNEIIEIDAENITDFFGNTYRYYDGAREKKEFIPKDADIIYNGMSAKSGFNKFVPELGGVIVIDNNEDGTADVVKITSYTGFLINNCNPSDEEFYNKAGRKLSYENTIWNVSDISGNPKSPESISAGQLLYVTVSEDGKLINGLVLSETVKGTVNGDRENGEYVTIGDAEYRITDECYKDFKILSMGDTAEFYEYGGVLLAVAAPSGSFDSRVCYVVRILPTDEDENMANARIFTENGEMLLLKVSDKLKVYCGGERVGGIKNVFELFCNATGEMVPQPAIYKLNSNGEIIYFEKAGISKESLFDEAEGLQLVYENSSATYNYRSSSLDEGKFQLMREGYAFSIPEDVKDLDEYRVLKITEFYPETSTESFDIKGYRTGNDIFGANIIVGTDIVRKTVSDSYLLIDKIGTALSSEGEICYTVKGIENGTTEIELKTEDKEVFDEFAVEAGDLLRYNLNTDGEINHINLIYDKSTGYMSQNPTSKFQGSVNRIACGDVYKIVNGVIAMNLTKSGGLSLEDVHTNKDYSNIEYVDANTFNIVEFDSSETSGSCISKKSIGVITDYVTSPDDYSKIVVCWRNWGYPGTVIIYK